MVYPPYVGFLLRGTPLARQSRVAAPRCGDRHDTLRCLALTHGGHTPTPKNPRATGILPSCPIRLVYVWRVIMWRRSSPSPYRPGDAVAWTARGWAHARHPCSRWMGRRPSSINAWRAGSRLACEGVCADVRCARCREAPIGQGRPSGTARPGFQSSVRW